MAGRLPMFGQITSHYCSLALLAVLVAELSVANRGQHRLGRGSAPRIESLAVLPVANEMQMKLAPQEQAPPTSARPVNPEAHALYLKGRSFWNKRTKEDLAKSRDYFRQALRKDPRCEIGRAHV